MTLTARPGPHSGGAQKDSATRLGPILGQPFPQGQGVPGRIRREAGDLPGNVAAAGKGQGKDQDQDAGTQQADGHEANLCRKPGEGE